VSGAAARVRDRVVVRAFVGSIGRVRTGRSSASIVDAAGWVRFAGWSWLNATAGLGWRTE
jgi:hypothetical protein